MGLIKRIATCLLIGGCLSPTISSADSSTFDVYADSAMKVYSQFKEPSIEQSERFFTFIKNKWSSTQCTETCSVDGYEAATEYAKLMKIKLEDEI